MTRLFNVLAAGLLSAIVLGGCVTERSTPADVRFATPAATFVVSGELTYLPRIALPRHSVMVVQVRGGPAPSGVVLAEQRVPLDGLQVPVPFSLHVPETRLQPGTIPVLRGIVMADGRSTWASVPLAIDAATGDVDVGALVMQRQGPLAFPTIYQCGDRTLMVGHDSERLIMRVGSESLRMRQVVSPAGRRYEAEGDPTTTFLDRGTEARVTRAGETWEICRPAAAAQTLFVASGNEPGWRLDLDAESLTLSADYGALRLAAPTPLARQADGMTLYRTRSGTGGNGARGVSAAAHDLEIRIEEVICRDDMTGMPRPQRVLLLLGDRRLRGCGGDPLMLLGGQEWVIEALNGDALLDESRATVDFMEANRLAGRASCNHYAGTFRLGGEGLTTEAIYATESACGAELMLQERGVLDVLRELRRFDIDDSGALVLYAGDGRRLTARR